MNRRLTEVDLDNHNRDFGRLPYLNGADVCIALIGVVSIGLFFLGVLG